MNIIETIEKYNLSIRRIPDKVVSVYEISHILPGDEIIGHNGRQFARRTKIPKNAGKYMCQSVKNTSSMVQWNTKTDNLAPSLEESIALFLQNNKT